VFVEPQVSKELLTEDSYFNFIQTWDNGMYPFLYIRSNFCVLLRIFFDRILPRIFILMLDIRWLFYIIGTKNGGNHAIAPLWFGGSTIFFLEHVGELRIIILRRNELEPVQHPPQYKLNFKLHQQPLETKKEMTYLSKLLFPVELGHQKGNPFCPSQLPNNSILLSLTQSSCQTRRSSIKHTLIAMFSQCPCSQNHQRVKALRIPILAQ
jgi:hypothetical protein